MLIQVGRQCKWTNDSKFLLSGYFDTIKNSPSQMYHSILQLCPPSSWLQKCYGAELSLGVKVVEGPAKWRTFSHSVSPGNYKEIAEFTEFSQELKVCFVLLSPGSGIGSDILSPLPQLQKIPFSTPIKHSQSVPSLNTNPKVQTLIPVCSSTNTNSTYSPFKSLKSAVMFHISPPAQKRLDILRNPLCKFAFWTMCIILSSFLHQGTLSGLV